mmetsp:Transcript_37080/g.76000  ORF Transcript_37080/g.76000 Transcript_37080/m.76000 type:complete len:128 (+) Transcript_37080:493-876(+)
MTRAQVVTPHTVLCKWRVDARVSKSPSQEACHLACRGEEKSRAQGILRGLQVSLFLTVHFPHIQRHFDKIAHFFAPCQEWSHEDALQVCVQGFLPHRDESRAEAAKRLLGWKALYADHDIWKFLIES